MSARRLRDPPLMAAGIFAPLAQGEPNGKGLGSADERRCGAAGFSGKLDGSQAGEQLLEEHSHFEPRQMLTQTNVSAVTEGNMARRIAVDAEAIGCFEGLLVAVTGRVRQHQPVTLGDVAPAQNDVSRRRAHEMLYRRGPTHGLLDELGDEAAIRLGLTEFARVLT